ncbi:MAG: hypothetical protein ACM3S1_03895 [Hyphomicrobiales bacterium]
MQRQSAAAARRYGAVMTVVSLVAAALFLVGLARRSYAALAIPVATVVLGGLAVAVWLGRLLMTTPEPPEDF